MSQNSLFGNNVQQKDISKNTKEIKKTKSFPTITVFSGLLKDKVCQDGIYWMRLLAYRYQKDSFSANKNFLDVLKNEIAVKNGSLPINLAVCDLLIKL